MVKILNLQTVKYWTYIVCLYNRKKT